MKIVPFNDSLVFKPKTSYSFSLRFAGPSSNPQEAVAVTVKISTGTGKIVNIEFTDVIRCELYNPTSKPQALEDIKSALEKKLDFVYMVNSVPEGTILFEATLLKGRKTYRSKALVDVTKFGRGAFDGEDARDLELMHM